jgi:hypothetical protein
MELLGWSELLDDPYRQYYESVKLFSRYPVRGRGRAMTKAA